MERLINNKINLPAMINRQKTTKKGFQEILKPFFIGDRERIRTAGLPLRRRSLYPAELHNHVFRLSEIISQTRNAIKTGFGKHNDQRYQYKIERKAVDILRFRDEDKAPSDYR